MEFGDAKRDRLDRLHTRQRRDDIRRRRHLGLPEALGVAPSGDMLTPVDARVCLGLDSTRRDLNDFERLAVHVEGLSQFGGRPVTITDRLHDMQHRARQRLASGRSLAITTMRAGCRHGVGGVAHFRPLDDPRTTVADFVGRPVATTVDTVPMEPTRLVDFCADRRRVGIFPQQCARIDDQLFRGLSKYSHRLYSS